MAPEQGMVKRLMKGEVIPEGVTFLSKDQIRKLQESRLKKLRQEQPFAAWPLTYGPAIAGSACGYTSMHLHDHFKKVFKVSRHAGIIQAALCVAYPGVMLFAGHQVMVVPYVLTGRVDCSICFETKLGFTQIALGVLTPMCFSGLMCFAMSKEHYTFDFNVPNLKKNTRNYLKFFMDIMPPLGKTSLLALGSMTVGMLLGQRMFDCYENILMKDMESKTVYKRDFD